MKRNVILLFVFVFVLNCNAQLQVWPDGAISTGNTIDKSFFSTSLFGWDHRFYLDASKYLHIQIGSSNPRISGTGNCVVFYEWTTNTFNDIQIRNLYQYSDRKAKKNILPVFNALEKVKSLNPVTYNWNVGDARKASNGTPLQEIGFLAQDVEQILPEAVIEDDEGRKLLNYTALIPILTESIKELETQIDVLKEEIANLKSEKSSITINHVVSENILFQNVPNPFSESTRIGYSISNLEHVSSIYIFNLEGKLLLKKPIMETGKGEVVIQAQELSSGMYLYSLVVDNKVIDTKRMVLTN